MISQHKRRENMNTQEIDIQKIMNMKKIHDAYIAKKMKKNDVGYGMSVFLCAIHAKKFQSQQELSDFVECNKAHTSRMIIKMQDKGLIKQNMKISLTEKGKKLAEKCKEYNEEFALQLIENINKKDLETFKNVMKQIFANAETIKINEEVVD